MNTIEPRAVEAARPDVECEGIQFARLAKSLYFTRRGVAGIWQKTGQRSARRCGLSPERVQKVRPWELVMVYELPEERWDRAGNSQSPIANSQGEAA